MREDTGDEAYFGALWENREFFYEYASEIGWSIQGMVFRYYFLHQAYPELLDFPFLWQQAEYVLGGGSSNYLFLVLAVIKAQTEEQGRNS